MWLWLGDEDINLICTNWWYQLGNPRQSMWQWVNWTIFESFVFQGVHTYIWWHCWQIKAMVTFAAGLLWMLHCGWWWVVKVSRFTFLSSQDSFVPFISFYFIFISFYFILFIYLSPDSFVPVPASLPVHQILQIHQIHLEFRNSRIPTSIGFRINELNENYKLKHSGLGKNI